MSALTGVDPALVPSVSMPSGGRMPVIGMGTFGSDSVSADSVANAVLDAAGLGYRHFDCAMVYGNEKEIGEALLKARAFVPRDELFVTSKLWNDKHSPKDVIPTCEQTMRDLNLDYLDMYLIHWPFPNTHDTGCDVTARHTDAKPYIHEHYMETWREMEKLRQQGKARNIGTSNMTVPKLKLLLRDASIKPACNQLELHPHFQQPELLSFIKSQGIVPVGFCPMGSPGRPERDRTPDDTVDLADPALVNIAGKYGVHPSAIALRWSIQVGAVPIPFSTSPAHLISNLKAALLPPLTSDEMSAISAVDKKCRLVKGQVFLWREGQPWEDLWDEDGDIAE